VKLLLLTDRTLTSGRRLIEVVRAAVEGGAEQVVLREKDVSRSERAALADELRGFSPLIDADVHAALSVDASLAARNVAGGTAPDAVRRALADARRLIGE